MSIKNITISTAIVLTYGGLTGILVAYAISIDFEIIAFGLCALGVLFVLGRVYARNETIDLVKKKFPELVRKLFY